MAGGIPPGGSYDTEGWDGPIVGAGLSSLINRTEENVRAAKSAEVRGDSGLKALSDMVFDGLDASLGLPVAILTALARALGLEGVVEGIGDVLSMLQGWGEDIWNAIEDAFEWVAQLVDSILVGVFGIEPIGTLLDRILDLVDEFGFFFDDFNGLIFDLWTDPGKVIQKIPQELVEGLVSALSSLGNWIESIVDNLLLALGITPEGGFLDRLFDLSDELEWLRDTAADAFDDVGNLIGSIVESLTGIVDLGLIPVGELFNLITSALSAIPFVNVLGVGGPANIGDALQETWNQFVGGLVGTVGSGASLADLFNIGQLVSSWASLGRLAFDILGIRSNKSLDSGLLATSEATFSLTEVASGSTPPTINVTQSNAVIGFQRIAESAPKRVVSWLGSGTANITAFYVRIWKMYTDTGDMELVYESENIVGDLVATMAWHFHELSEPLEVEPGEVYGIELALVGAGTHQVVGKETWLPDHPATYPKNLAATRNSGTDPAPATIDAEDVAYSQQVPWIEFGIDYEPVDIHGQEVHMFNQNTQIPVPSWANEVDVICLGGGGGGHQGGIWGISGEGGGAGQWATDTWVRGEDFDGPTVLNVSIGAGGEGGGGQGDNGGNTTISITDGPSLTGTGGAGGDSFEVIGGDRHGKSPGNKSYNGNLFVGGAQQSSHGRNGNPPGGGGAGGDWVAASLGGHGAAGAAWVVFRS